MFQVKILFLAVVAALVTAERTIEPRIVQGHDATRGQFPFYVYMKSSMAQGVASCGGSLISNQWILTAGHCVKFAASVEVHLGSLRAEDTKEDGRKIFKIQRRNIYEHPKFSLIFFAWNDIALIKLPKPVEFSNVIKPVPLACSSTSGMDVIAIGNGLTKDGNTHIAPILQYTELKTVSTLSCLKNFPFLIFRKSVICAKGEQHKSACRGDSGGPLVSKENALIGLTSLGSPRGCETGAPSVYTRISQYLKWIEEVTGVKCKN